MEDCGRQQESGHLVNLGTFSFSFGKYGHAIRHYDQALVMERKIGNRSGEATCHIKLGNVFTTINNMVKAKEHFEKALVIACELGNRTTEGICYAHLGRVSMSLCECVMAEEYLKKALSKSTDIKDLQLHCYFGLAFRKIYEKKFNDALSYLNQST